MKKKLLPNILLALCLGLILNYIFLGQMNWKNDTLCQEIASARVWFSVEMVNFNSGTVGNEWHKLGNSI